MNTQINNTLIDEVTRHLIKAYNPLVIYLFCSYAWGSPDKSGDIDLSVIVDKYEYDAAERIRIGLRELKDIHADIDILVYTSAEVATWNTHPSTLTYKVLNRGVKLYEAA
jgi:predicted nucleotidyltransferase